MTRRIVCAVALSLLVTACTNTTDPIVTDEVCQRWVDEGFMQVVPIIAYCGNGCTTMTTQVQYVPVYVCKEAIMYAEPNPEYLPR